MKKLLTTLLLSAIVGTGGAAANSGGYGSLPGIVIRPDQRFDPFIQRLLAREDLRAMPIGSSGLLYLVPVTQDPYLQEMQIRYLDQLLREKKAKDEPGAETP